MAATLQLRIFVVTALALACSCTDPSVAACEGNCDKRDACAGGVDVTQCHRACADSAPRGNATCVEADVALQNCQIDLSCPDYEAGTGCDDERAAVAAACF